MPETVPPLLTPLCVDFSTIFGRVVGALRQEIKKSQAEFSRDIKWDRGLLARIESGRNTAGVDNIYELGTQFRDANLIHRRADLFEIADRVAARARERGLRIWVGNLPKPDGEGPIEVLTLDRIVSRVVDDWLDEMRQPNQSIKE